MTLRENQRNQRADARVSANTRLTAITGAVLFVLFFFEGLSLLGVRAHLGWHVALGGAIVPFVVVKAASTSWRFAKYYLGSPAYVRRGAPHLVLRLLGPFQILLTVLLLASGLYLVLAQPGTFRTSMVTWHKLIFFPWFGVTTIHVLGHFRETAVHGREDYVPRLRRLAPGPIARQVILIVTLGAAVGMWMWLYPKAATYINPFHFSPLG
jgi:uncharacterized membrane protein